MFTPTKTWYIINISLKMNINSLNIYSYKKWISNNKRREIKMKKRYLVIMLILLSVVSLLIGAKNITISDIISFKNDSINIMLISRVPRLIAILLAGIGMSICGLIMQQISKNKFVSPTTGATIDSAQLGIVVAMILMPNASSMQKALVSFVFALAGTYIFMKFIRTLKFKDAIFIPLVGIMCGNIIGAITSFLGYQFEFLFSLFPPH